jgi:hypothetical protein
LVAVYPGDSITNIFALDIVNQHWANIWFDSPGEEGGQAGLGPFSGALSFDLAKYRASPTMVPLAIPLSTNSAEVNVATQTSYSIVCSKSHTSKESLSAIIAD